ncbi:MAG TPA: VWA domain-containing protein [Terriglobia bacterium]|nr:VWA domain-containing protein [Terriglobia bacterium]
MNRAKGKTGVAVFVFAILTCALSAQQQSSSPQQQEPKVSAHSVKVDVDLVLANVTVTLRDGRFVTGLEKENFKLTEDKVPQDIVYFSSEDIPVSVGIILDVSGSMKDKLKTAVEAAVTFMKGGSPDDEYFLVEFADKPTDITDFTNDIAKIQNRFIVSKAKGRTALYDAVYMGLTKLEQGNNAKRALLLITDGEDNRSRYTFSNVREFVKEKDVQMYAIGITNGWGDAAAEQGRALLRDLAAISGGNSFFPSSVYNLEEICRNIAKELKYQYVLGYHSTNQAKDGEWRKIKVTAELPNNKLTVRSKQGYYGPSPASGN